MPETETVSWKVLATLEKWHQSEDHEAGLPPDEVMHDSGNLLLNAGITLMWNRLIGSGTAFSNTVARIGVAESATAAAATQTDLQGSTKYYMTMDSTYPSVSAQTVTFKATFASGVANHVWAEWIIDQGTAANTGPVVATCLNRKVSAMGTKASGATWTLTVAITLA